MKRVLIVLFCCCFGSIGVLHAQSNAPSLDDLIPSNAAKSEPRLPQTAADIAKLRAKNDDTVWAKEVVSQRYESSIVTFWDRLRESANPYEVLASLDTESWQIGASPKDTSLGNDIAQRSFGTGSQLSKSEFQEQLARFRKAGFEIVGSELRHLNFQKSADSAESIVRMRLFVKRLTPARTTRLIVSGDIKIIWSKQPIGTPAAYVPQSVDLQQVKILQRNGEPLFEQAMAIPYKVADHASKRRDNSLRPILIADLDGDHLPEIVLPSINEVWRNGGRWRFARQQLFDQPRKGISAAVAADFDRDGNVDLLCANRGSMLLYRGDADSQFTAAPDAFRFRELQLINPVALTAGDIDRDGDLDIFLGQSKETHLYGDVPTPYFDAQDGFGNVLLLNNGKGKFADATNSAGLETLAKRRVNSATFLDMNDDGHLDLVTTSDFAGTEYFTNDGRGSFKSNAKAFGSSAKSLGQGHAFGDFNTDGAIDIVSLGISSVGASRLQNMKLSRPGFEDFDGLRTQMSQGNQMYVSSAGETTTLQQVDLGSAGSTGWPFGAASADFDRDGSRDLFVVNGRLSGKTARDYDSRFWCHDIYFREGKRPDRAIGRYFLRFAPLFGKLFSWHGFENNALIMRTKNDQFVDVGFLMLGDNLHPDSRGAVSADLDKDGRMDLIYEEVQVGSSESTLRILKNTSREDHHWIGFNFANSEANLYGTKVTVRFAGRSLTEHVLAGDGRSIQRDASVHFGLGDVSQVESVEVVRPDGTKSQIRKPIVNAYQNVD